MWLDLFEKRWGSVNPIVQRAAKLAGGWKRLYAAKSVHERKVSPWTQPCEYELRASLEALAAKKMVQPDKELAVIFLLDGSGSVHEGRLSSDRVLIISVSALLLGEVAWLS